MLVRQGADEKLLTTEWLENHYAQIVWKLACMERSFPVQCANQTLTIDRTIKQLKYRCVMQFY